MKTIEAPKRFDPVWSSDMGGTYRGTFHDMREYEDGDYVSYDEVQALAKAVVEEWDRFSGRCREAMGEDNLRVEFMGNQIERLRTFCAQPSTKGVEGE